MCNCRRVLARVTCSDTGIYILESGNVLGWISLPGTKIKRRCVISQILRCALRQGWKFSDFSLISDFFTSTILKISFEISS